MSFIKKNYLYLSLRITFFKIILITHLEFLIMQILTINQITS